MIAKKHLVAAYHSWEELTQAEGAAIQSDDWLRVSEYQHTKQGLQKQIIHLTEAAQVECVAAGSDPKLLERDLRRIINSLITLESRNSELLAGRRQIAQVEKAHLDQSVHNLRRVQKSYSPPADALWNSYS
jgi:hypothetical protein